MSHATWIGGGIGLLVVIGLSIWAYNTKPTSGGSNSGSSQSGGGGRGGSAGGRPNQN